MVSVLGDKSRFIALKQMLMDPLTGLVKSFEHDVKWGLVMYDGPSDDPSAALPDGGTPMFSLAPATTCPRIVSVEPKKNNFADVDAMYPPAPLGGSSPTDRALDAVIAHLPDGGTSVGVDTALNPTIIVLATDGAANDRCSTSAAIDSRSQVIDRVKTLAAKGFKTYVISLAGDDPMLTQHLQQVAQEGLTGKPPFTPMNLGQLTQTVRDIIGPERACDVTLDGSVKVGLECSGKVEINGNALPCNDANGWHLKDSSTIAINGSACEAYQRDDKPVLRVDFPCDILTQK